MYKLWIRMKSVDLPLLLIRQYKDFIKIMIQNYHFTIDIIENWKFPWYCKKSDYERIRSNKSENFTIYKYEILKNIQEIWGLIRISKYIEDLYVNLKLQFRETDQRTGFELKCTM